MLRRRRFGAAGGRTDITRLFRNPPQLEVLAAHLAGRPRPLRVLVYGVADGAEAVSLLAFLAPEPGTAAVVGRDVDDDLLACARAGRYLPEHAPAGLPPEAEAVLEPAGRGWSLRAERRGDLRYEAGDVRRAGEDAAAAHDLVCCQNTLVMFDADDVGPAIAGLAGHVAPGGLLALGGGPLDQVAPAARSCGFEPVLDRVGEVHEAWEVQRRFWDNDRPPRWALEPYDPRHPHGPERYASVFVRSER